MFTQECFAIRVKSKLNNNPENFEQRSSEEMNSKKFKVVETLMNDPSKINSFYNSKFKQNSQRNEEHSNENNEERDSQFIDRSEDENVRDGFFDRQLNFNDNNLRRNMDMTIQDKDVLNKFEY